MCRKLVLIAAFARNREGSIAVVFALAAMLLFSVVGGALDVARAMSARGKMQAAADAAVLAAANDPYQWESQAKKVAKDFFEAAKTQFTRDIEPSYKVSRTYSFTSVDVTIEASASVETTLLKVVGKPTIEITATATASRPANLVDIYAVVDMSASMGIAADEANRAKLVQLTKPYTATGNGCAFACHQLEPYLQLPGGQTVSEFAKANKIRTREDVMKVAFSAFVDEMLNPKDDAVKYNQRRIATYGFSGDLQRLLAPTSSISQVKDSLSSYPDSKRTSTRFRDVLPQVTNEVGYSGQGTWFTPKKMVLLVTDGVEWPNWPTPGGGPFDPKLCDDLKKNGVEIAVLEVKYFEDLSEKEFFVPLIKPFYPQITPNLQACASSGLYFRVEDSAEAQLKAAFADVAKAMKPKLGLIK